MLQPTTLRNQVQLITYVDRFGGGGFEELAELLDGPLANLFGGVHLLPFFYPIDGADAGFDPVDHRRIDERPLRPYLMPSPPTASGFDPTAMSLGPVNADLKRIPD